MFSSASTSSLLAQVSVVPAGRWGIAVSGGADSTCLLRLAATRSDLALHVLHLDHETRGQASTGDAQFVAELAAELNIDFTVERISQLLASLDPAERNRLPANRSARYRALRLKVFERAVQKHNLQGVLLAHHADDKAETVMLRLIRGGGFASLTGMAERTLIGDLTLLRPLLGVRRQALREYLGQIGQTWREDASNARDDQARNRVRKVLADQPALIPALCDVATSCRRLRDWATSQSPVMKARLPVQTVWNLPEVVGGFALGEWLRERGVPVEQISGQAIQGLLIMCTDAASPSRISMPGGLAVRRRGGEVFVD